MEGKPTNKFQTENVEKKIYNWLVNRGLWNSGIMGEIEILYKINILI